MSRRKKFIHTFEEVFPPGDPIGNIIREGRERAISLSGGKKQRPRFISNHRGEAIAVPPMGSASDMTKILVEVNQDLCESDLAGGL